MPFQLVVIQGRSANQALKLVAPVTTVGRQDGCQLQIRSSQVSRKHCELFEKKGLLLVKDLGSSNGTFVNGKKVDEQRVLEPGDELTIGAVKFRVEAVSEAPADRPAAGGKPGDTSIAEPVAVGEDDVIDLDEETVAPEVDSEAPSEEAQPVAVEAKDELDIVPEPAQGESEPEAEAAQPELGEDAVAEFLLDLDLDEDDKV